MGSGLKNKKFKKNKKNLKKYLTNNVLYGIIQYIKINYKES